MKGKRKGVQDEDKEGAMSQQHADRVRQGAESMQLCHAALTLRSRAATTSNAPDMKGTTLDALTEKRSLTDVCSEREQAWGRGSGSR